MITVFHNSNFMSANISLLINPGTIPTIDFTQLTQVAVVNTDNLGEAFLMTQHHQESWHDNPDIQVIQKSRSTSVGDVLQTSNGNYWLVSSDDFLPLENRQNSELDDSDIFQSNKSQESGSMWILPS